MEAAIIANGRQVWSPPQGATCSSKYYLRAQVCSLSAFASEQRKALIGLA
jgi:hypothetical protein